MWFFLSFPELKCIGFGNYQRTTQKPRYLLKKFPKIVPEKKSQSNFEKGSQKIAAQHKWLTRGLFKEIVQRIVSKAAGENPKGITKIISKEKFKGRNLINNVQVSKGTSKNNIPEEIAERNVEGIALLIPKKKISDGSFKGVVKEIHNKSKYKKISCRRKI